ncbi:adenine deaminase [Gorillibacterium massiliense]|uniref:adenine deaminase n=1 Tax=Gorillibacterium massiliense TaxID=1280390 RepID=UPI0004AFF7BA|nr:adenine deaminase [Gorillibacterium massiliense]
MADCTEQLKRRILVAGKKEPADLVVKNGKIMNVFTGEVMEGDIAVVDGIIAGIGDYSGESMVDAQGKIIVPGFIDGHLHIESTMLAPQEFSKILLQHGVTTVMADPHEIANVAGTDGLDYILENSQGLPMDIFIMLPSSVPVTPFESNGAVLHAEQLRPYLDHPMVLGLAEVMDFPSVAGAEDTMLRKLAAFQSHPIDGHAAGIGREGLNVYVAAGIRNDHEGVSYQDAVDRLSLGMRLMIREGTVAKNLEALLPAVTPLNARRCLFVTDDKLLDDLVEEGSIDHIVRLAIAKGLDPIMAVQMATINAAEAFRLQDRGAIAPGFAADFVLLDDLRSVAIHSVYKGGICVAEKGAVHEELFPVPEPALPKPSISTFHVKEVHLKDFELPLASDLCHIIEIIPNQIVTNHLRMKVDNDNGLFRPSLKKDQLKMAVVERHRATGNIGLGIVKGFQLNKGAIATSVAHDSHNIVIVGTTDEDMFAALQKVLSMNGGLAVVADGEVLASLPLPIGGLMTEQKYTDVYANLKKMNESLKEIGAPAAFDPFLTLSFLTLPVIPHLKLTDKGLFDFHSFRIIPVEADSE